MSSLYLDIMQPNSNWVKNDQDYAVVFMHKTLDYTGTQML